MGFVGSFTLLIFVIINSFSGLQSYETIDYEIFDLVEEIDKNFYEVFGIDSKATTSEVKRAYRRLAIQYHPDKYDGEDAEDLFRQIAAIYDVLKDDDKRQRYDLVLETGLPDWKQPVFYFRRVRKLGLLEMSVILLCILTVGHFLVLWASYLEKKYEIEEVFRSKQPREKKSRGRLKQQQQEEKEAELEEQLQDYLDCVPRPRILDLVPFRLVASIWSMCVYVIHTPRRLREWQKQKEEERLREELEIREERERIEEIEQHKEAQKKRKKVDLVKIRGEMMASQIPGEPVVYMDYNNDSLKDNATYSTEKHIRKEGTAWSDEEMTLLAKAVAKFPGGTPNRWDKISDLVGHSPKEVITMTKHISEGYARTVDASAQGITGSLSKTDDNFNPAMIGDGIITQAEWEHSHPDNNKKRPDDDLDSAMMSMMSAGNAAVRKRRKGQRLEVNQCSNATGHGSNSSQETTDSNKMNLDGFQNGSDKSRTETPQSGKLQRNSKAGSFHKADSLSYHQANSNLQNASVSSDTRTETCSSSSGQLKADSGQVSDDSLAWSQNQQKILEWALSQYKKGTEDRWGRIAEHIEGKTKEDCMMRYKYLAEMVRKKKAQQQAS